MKKLYLPPLTSQKNVPKDLESRLETAHARTPDLMTEDLDRGVIDSPPITKPGIRYVFPEFNGEGSPRASEAEYIIEKSLLGPPSDWWLIIKNYITSLDSYLTKFQPN